MPNSGARWWKSTPKPSPSPATFASAQRSPTSSSTSSPPNCATPNVSDQPTTDYTAIQKSTPELFAAHDSAVAKLRTLLADDTFDWEQEIDFVTRSAGTIIATRRTILFHALLHSMRHYAQLATLLRHQGIAASWPMDYLFMGVRWL
jgi:hypothetical protein